MRPNGGVSSSGTQNMQSSTGQYSTPAGDPAQPVQHSVITASSFGFFLRAVTIPFERGSNFCASGTIPGAFTTSGALAISSDFTLSVKSLSAWFLPPLQQSRACYNARAIPFGCAHVPKNFLQTSRARPPRRTCAAPLFHLALPLLLRRHRLLRGACPQLALPRYLWFLLPRTASAIGCARPWLSGIPRRDLPFGRYRQKSGHARASHRRSCHVRFRRGHRLSPGGRRFGSLSWPRRSHRALAHGSLPVHRQLHRCSPHGGSGNIFHHARAAGFFVTSRNGARQNFLEQRLAWCHKNLVRGRPRRWSRNARPTGSAAGSFRCPGRALATLSRSDKLETAHCRDSVDVRWIAVAARALGRAQCSQSRPRAIPRTALRGNLRRRAAHRLLCVDKNLDVSFSRRLSLHLEGAHGADRREESSGVRRGFA